MLDANNVTWLHHKYHVDCNELCITVSKSVMNKLVLINSSLLQYYVALTSMTLMTMY